MVNACLHCQKYIFDGQNVNQYKRMTIKEYINGVYRKNIRENSSDAEVCIYAGYKLGWFVNKAPCELCGAPHAVFTDADFNVVGISFFFSGLDKPSEKDVQFINHFRRDYFGR